VRDQLIVVPLDGSELSEGVLPYATAIAKATSSRLLLVTVWEGAEAALSQTFPTLAEDVFRQGEAHYEAYLKQIVDRETRAGVTIDAEVLTGDPAERLLGLIAERGADLLALATHGRSGLGRWVYGSVAGKLIREADVPTLAVGPNVLEAKAQTATITRILLPLDGSELSELALQPAGELAAALGAEIVLTQVLRWATQAFAFGVPDVDVARVDEQLAEAAHAYLAARREALGAKASVRTIVLRGTPAEAIIDLVESERIDLIVMASHTRAGLARAVLGSVADRVIQGKAPVLLFRPPAG
jgi:nucleotide-binding universal stress UspA family protein